MLSKFSDSEIKLFHAAKELDDVRNFLAQGMPVDAIANGRTKLFVAALTGNLPLIKILIDAGANINIRNTTAAATTVTALNASLLRNGAEVAMELLGYGANPRIYDNARRTAGHYLVMHAERMLAEEGGAQRVSELLTKMCGAGLVINQGDNRGNTPLHTAVEKKLPAGFITTMIDHGADPLVRNKDGAGALHLACTLPNVPAVEAFLRAGVDVNAADELGKRPIYLFVGTDVGEVVLSHNPDLESRDDLGRTALLSRVLTCGPGAIDEQILLLIRAGADTGKASFEGVTVEDVIRKRGLFQVAAAVAANRARVAIQTGLTGTAANVMECDRAEIPRC